MVPHMAQLRPSCRFEVGAHLDCRTCQLVAHRPLTTCLQHARPPSLSICRAPSTQGQIGRSAVCLKMSATLLPKVGGPTGLEVERGTLPDKGAIGEPGSGHRCMNEPGSKAPTAFFNDGIIVMSQQRRWNPPRACSKPSGLGVPAEEQRATGCDPLAWQRIVPTIRHACAHSALRSTHVR